MSKSEWGQAKRLLRALLRWGIPLTLLAACSPPDPVDPTPRSPQPAVQPTPAVASYALPHSASASTSTLIDTRSPEELVAAMPPGEQAKTVINFLGIALFAYRCHTGQYPSQQQALRALVERPNDIQPPGLWQGAYSPEIFLVDPWGKPYEYRWLDGPQLLFDLRSLGPDGTESDDDITLAQLSMSARFAQRDYVEHFAQLYSRQGGPAQALLDLAPSTPMD
jgi:type II secretion system protein G